MLCTKGSGIALGCVVHPGGHANMHNNKVSCALTILHTVTPLVVSEIPILQMVKLNRKYVVTHPRPPSLERWGRRYALGPWSSGLIILWGGQYRMEAGDGHQCHPERLKRGPFHSGRHHSCLCLCPAQAAASKQSETHSH